MNIVDHYAAWLARGYHPVPQIGKRVFDPRTYDAPLTVDQFRSVCLNLPGIGLGLKIGPIGGLIDVDVDNPAISNHREIFGRVDTFSYTTSRSRGSVHMLFSWDARLLPYSQELSVWNFGGWELRLGNSQGRQSATVPPTCVRGVVREWFGSSLSAPPLALYDFLSSRMSDRVENRVVPRGRPVFGPQDVSVARKRALAWLAKARPAISQANGHRVAFRELSFLKGFSTSESEFVEYARMYNDICEPPFSEVDLQHKIREVISRSAPFGSMLG